MDLGTRRCERSGRTFGSAPSAERARRGLARGGRIERTLFTLNWLKDTDLHRSTNAGLNKDEARNALARAVFLHRLGSRVIGRSIIRLTVLRVEPAARGHHPVEYALPILNHGTQVPHKAHYGNSAAAQPTPSRMSAPTLTVSPCPPWLSLLRDKPCLTACTHVLGHSPVCPTPKRPKTHRSIPLSPFPIADISKAAWCNQPRRPGWDVSE